MRPLMSLAITLNVSLPCKMARRRCGILDGDNLPGLFSERRRLVKQRSSEARELDIKCCSILNVGAKSGTIQPMTNINIRETPIPSLDQRQVRELSQRKIVAGKISWDVETIRRRQGSSLLLFDGKLTTLVFRYST